ncbi:MAG: 16S rRNA (guanine(527)-N(7))-methyltransferase RsmG [Ruminococcus sp.]|nr:16S rRNA (guanine(527)-N(7))-methyltransferase RsmG [Ruminococcus sp.]
MLSGFEYARGEFEKYGFELTEKQYGLFDKYAGFLVKYNENVNLTAITEPDEILSKHFIDSCIILKYIDIPQNSTLIDVGTGAGFPSVPLKIMRPDIKITLLDSLNKRIVFLQKLCEILCIDAEFIHGRAEDIAKDLKYKGDFGCVKYRENFDFVCARAVANMSLLSELCMPFVKYAGNFIAMKGPSEDINSGRLAIRTLGGAISKIYEYKLGGDARKLVHVIKISHTPTRYPRSSGQIKKKPLG